MSGLLASASYDPSTAGSFSLAALSAMTAVDTTNLRVTFTVPANGIVLVRMRGNLNGATLYSQVLLGVLEGSTVRGRSVANASRAAASSAGQMGLEAVFPVTGLTPAASLTWDYAIGVETAVASQALRYGGPNDTTITNAYGAASLEIWSTEALLAAKQYDPSTVANFSVAALAAMTAIDTTNLRHTFTVPASGNVAVRLRGCVHGGTANSGGIQLLGILQGASVITRQRATATWQDNPGTNPSATTLIAITAKMMITGLTPSDSLTWDAAVGIEQAFSSGSISYGGPNDTTTDNAYGGFTYEIWDASGASSAPQIYMLGQVI